MNAQVDIEPGAVLDSDTAPVKAFGRAAALRLGALTLAIIASVALPLKL